MMFWDKYTDEDLRVNALWRATQAYTDALPTVDQIVARAEAYYSFLKGTKK